MENKFKNQILSEDLQNITIENQEEPSKNMGKKRRLRIQQDMGNL